MSRGHLALVLHAHLPYVRHPEHDFFLEEEWLYEAITETYIPLLQAFERMVADNLPFRLTLSLSPSLVSMLTDELLKQRYWNYLIRLRKLIGAELKRTRKNAQLNYLAESYRLRIEDVMATWESLQGDLVKAFGLLQDKGYLDILTCTATHGYLPLMQVCPEAVWAQIKIGVDQYQEHFGRKPTGIPTRGPSRERRDFALDLGGVL